MITNLILVKTIDKFFNIYKIIFYYLLRKLVNIHLT